jgi:hypothetical protein
MMYEWAGVVQLRIEMGVVLVQWYWSSYLLENNRNLIADQRIPMSLEKVLAETETSFYS